MTTQKVHVILSDSAFMQIVHSGLESFTIKHLGRRKHNDQYLETYGLLWGSFTKIPEKDFVNFVYTVSYAGIDTSAETTRGTCLPNNDALKLKRDLMTSYWPQYRFLGDFHSHPYSRKEECDYKVIEAERRYNYSTPNDFERIEKYTKYWTRNNYRIGLVVTIVDMKNRSNSVRHRKESNLISLTFGNYRMWIKCYYANYKKKGIRLTDDILLHCPYLTGLDEFTRFGKHVDGSHEEGDLGKYD